MKDSCNIWVSQRIVIYYVKYFVDLHLQAVILNTLLRIGISYKWTYGDLIRRRTNLCRINVRKRVKNTLKIRALWQLTTWVVVSEKKHISLIFRATRKQAPINDKK